MIIEVGSPEWYYERFPGFYNNRCYEILSEWHLGVPPEKSEELPESVCLGNTPAQINMKRTMDPPPSRNKKATNYRKRKCRVLA